MFKTITTDNSSEYSELDTSVLSEDTEISLPPYTSCEPETNERHNGLMRRFIPKGKAVTSVSEDTIQYAENWCNRIPRKILSCRTPEEYFSEELFNIA